MDRAARGYRVAYRRPGRAGHVGRRLDASVASCHGTRLFRIARAHSKYRSAAVWLRMPGRNFDYAESLTLQNRSAGRRSLLAALPLFYLFLYLRSSHPPARNRRSRARKKTHCARC